MKVYSRPINTDETFCTSIKTAKSIFENTNVKLCFGEFRRQYVPHKNEIGYAYWKKNILGKVVAKMILEPSVDSPLLSFYVVKSTDVSNSMKKEFENVLCDLLEIYNKFLYSNTSQQRTTMLWIEMINNKFHIHQFVL